MNGAVVQNLAEYLVCQYHRDCHISCITLVTDGTGLATREPRAFHCRQRPH